MTRVIVIVGFLIAFGAGLMVGHVAWMPHPGGMPGGGPHGRPDSWIAQQLDLTPDQRVKMKQIWSDVSHRGGPQQGAKRQQLRHVPAHGQPRLQPQPRRPTLRMLHDRQDVRQIWEGCSWKAAAGIEAD